MGITKITEIRNGITTELTENRPDTNWESEQAQNEIQDTIDFDELRDFVLKECEEN